MHADRILILADHLEKNVKDEEFDLTFWRCRSVCCAVGHAASVPQFEEIGFHMEEHDSIFFPVLEDRCEWDAVMKLFDIDWKTAQWLFSENYYPNKQLTTRMEVVERLRLAERARNHNPLSHK